MESRTEKILRSIIDNTQYSEAAQSRIEAILLAIKNNTQYSEAAQSRIEAILLAIKNNTQYSEAAQSRIEAILLAKLNGTEYNQQPRSRIEELLIEWIDAGGVIEGIPPLTYKSVEGALNNYRIYGNTVDGKSVGELVTEGEHTGEYRVPVTVASKNLFNEAVVVDKAITEYTENYQVYHQDGKLYLSGFTTASQSDIEIALLTSVNAETLEYINNNFGVYHFSSACPGKIQTRYTIEGSSKQYYTTDKYTSNSSRTADRIVFRLQKDYQYNHERMDIQIERGNGSTSYEPYHEPITTNIYLPRPLRMDGDKADYIDFKKQKLYFVDGTSADVTLPALPTISGTNILSVTTEVQPSKVYVKSENG